MHFVAIHITIQTATDATLTVADAPYAHAAILHAMSSIDPTAGQKLHDTQRNKRMTIALFNPDRSRRMTCLRVVILADDDTNYAGVLLDALSHQSTLQLGRTAVDIQRVAVQGTPWSGIATWADLTLEHPEPSMNFSFDTPTAIMKTDDNGKRFSSVLPEPLDIFRGLARRWTGLGGRSLPDNLETFLQTGGCVVAHHRLKTVTFHTQERTQIGFIGNVTYHCRKHDPQCITALNALARLAFFTGVGYQTARGMGLVRTELHRSAT